MNKGLLLIADFVEGTWDGVVNAWCKYTQEKTLCLVPNEIQATAYLIVAKHAHQVYDALCEFKSRQLPVVWINEYEGCVSSYSSVEETLKIIKHVD